MPFALCTEFEDGLQNHGFGFSDLHHPPAHDGQPRRRRQVLQRPDPLLRARRQGHGRYPRRRQGVPQLLRLHRRHAGAEIWGHQGPGRGRQRAADQRRQEEGGGERRGQVREDGEEGREVHEEVRAA